MNWTRAFIVLMLVAGTPLSAAAKVLYVDRANGNDSVSYANNSATNPWASIGRAAWGSTNRNSPNTSEAARAGDLVIVRAGTYTTTGANSRILPAYNPANSGSSGSPITFQAEGTVVLTYSGGVGPVIGSLERTFITWKGFTINEVNAPSTPDTGPVVVWDSRGSSIENCTIVGRGNIQREDNYPGIRIEASMDILIRGNRVSNFHPGDNSPAIQLYRSGRIIMEHNEFTNVGTGINIKGTAEEQWNDWMIVRFNLMHGLAANADGVKTYRIGDPPYIYIYQNVFRDWAGSALTIHQWESDSWSAPRNVKFFNNTVDGLAAGIKIKNNPNPSVVGANDFTNNLITNNSRAITFEDVNPSTVTAANYRWYRNTYFNNPMHAGEIANGSSLSSWMGSGRDANSVTANPQYVNLAANDFRLQPSSPARTTGRAVFGVGGAAGATIPAGAYITGNEVIGPGGAGTASPTAPTNLRIVGQ